VITKIVSTTDIFIIIYFYITIQQRNLTIVWFLILWSDSDTI